MPDPGTVPSPAAVQNLLTNLYASPVTVEHWEQLHPWTIARVQLRGPAAPHTAIIKGIRTNRALAGSASWRLRNELAALQFLDRDIKIALTPRVIAADTATQVLVLEDLTPRVALDGLLRREGAAAHGERLAAFAQARGELSAATAGHADTYYARRTRLGPADPAADRAGRLAPLRDEALNHATALGVPLSSRAAHELTAALDELHSPGPFLALSNADAEANNVLLHPTGPPEARLIDFEFAGYAHALTDAVCLFVPGPAWITVGDPATTGLADHYRRALARGIPEAEDDRRYGFGLAAACISWALIRLQRFTLLDARSPGDHSRLQLIVVLEAAARTAQIHTSLSHLATWLRRIATLLRRRWPDADQDFADPARFPPYRVRNWG